VPGLLSLPTEKNLGTAVANGSNDLVPSWAKLTQRVAVKVDRPVPHLLGDSHMSPKQQRKFRGIRRVNRRPRGWARWFRDGLLELEPRGGMRLRLAINCGRS